MLGEDQTSWSLWKHRCSWESPWAQFYLDIIYGSVTWSRVWAAQEQHSSGCCWFCHQVKKSHPSYPSLQVLLERNLGNIREFLVGSAHPCQHPSSFIRIINPALQLLQGWKAAPGDRLWNSTSVFFPSRGICRWNNNKHWAENMAWLPESLNKHRVPSCKEIRANQGVQTHWAVLAFQIKGIQAEESSGEPLQEQCAFREAEIVFHMDSPFRAARPKRQKGIFRGMCSDAGDGCPPKWFLDCGVSPWGLPMTFITRPGLGRIREWFFNLSAPKETPAAPNSMCGAERHCPEAAACLERWGIVLEAIPAPAFIPGDVIDLQAGFRGNAQLPFPQLKPVPVLGSLTSPQTSQPPACSWKTDGL